MHAQWSGQEMAGQIRKLPLLATVFMVVCLVAAGFLQFYVITPLIWRWPARIRLFPMLKAQVQAYSIFQGKEQTLSLANSVPKAVA